MGPSALLSYSQLLLVKGLCAQLLLSVIPQYYGHIEGMKSLVFFQGSEFDFSEMVLQKMQAALEKWDKNPTGKRKKRGK